MTFTNCKLKSFCEGQRRWKVTFKWSNIMSGHPHLLSFLVTGSIKRSGAPWGEFSWPFLSSIFQQILRSTKLSQHQRVPLLRVTSHGRGENVSKEQSCDTEADTEDLQKVINKSLFTSWQNNKDTEYQLNYRLTTAVAGALPGRANWRKRLERKQDKAQGKFIENH